MKDSQLEEISDPSTEDYVRIVDRDGSTIVGSRKVQLGNLKTGLGAGEADGLATLDSEGKVPAAQLPDTTIEVTVTVANQAARFALTTATVQAGDRVKQTDDSSIWTLNDVSNIGNANGWLKTSTPAWTEITGKPASGFGSTAATFAEGNDARFTDIQTLTLAHNSTTTVVVTARLTILNISVGTTSSNSAILQLDGAEEGQLVVINKVNNNSSGAQLGGLSVRVMVGTTYTSLRSLPTANSFICTKLVLMRTAGLHVGAFAFTEISYTDSLGHIANIASKTVSFQVPVVRRRLIDMQSGLPATQTITSTDGTPFADRSTITVYLIDGENNAVSPLMWFQFIAIGDDTDIVPGTDPEARFIAAETDNLSLSAQLSALSDAIIGNAGGSIETQSFTDALGRVMLRINAAAHVGEGYRFVGLVEWNLPDGVTPATTASILIADSRGERNAAVDEFGDGLIATGVLLSVKAQAGSGGGANQSLTLQMNLNSGEYVSINSFVVPASMSANQVISYCIAGSADVPYGGTGLEWLADVAWSGRGENQQWNIFTSGNPDTGRTIVEITWIELMNLSQTLNF